MKIIHKFEIITEKMIQAFQCRSEDLFIECFDLDLLNKYYLLKAFHNYTMLPQKKCSYTIQVLEEDEFDILFLFDYEDSNHEEVLFKCKTKLVNGNIYIINCKIINILDMVQIDGSNLPICDFDTAIFEVNRFAELSGLVDYRDLMVLQRKTEENMNPSFYQRALTKSIRHRMSNPEIECGIILSNMVSKKMIDLCNLVLNNDRFACLKNANYCFNKMFKHKTYEEVKELDRNHFPVKELSLESVSANIDMFIQDYCQGFKPVEIRCSEIAHFYHSLFSLIGFADELFVLILPFHYMNYVQIGDEFYLIDVNHIVKMNNSRIYGVYDEIVGCATQQYYFNQFGFTNMPFSKSDKIVNTISQKMKYFNFKPIFKPKFVIGSEADLSIDSQLGANQNAFNILKKIYEAARTDPQSPYTYAKYSSQSIIVEYPQSYIRYSLDNKEVLEFSKQILNEEELYCWIRNEIRDGTVFTNSIQIMLADQIIRYKIGRIFEKSFLIYIVKKIHGWLDEGFLIFTNSNAYVYQRNNDCEKLFDLSSMQYLNRIEGEVIIAFNETDHYSLWSKTELGHTKIVDLINQYIQEKV